MEILKKLPEIIQGGMGVAVSNWTLANAVAREGQMGVVSGTGIDTVVARRLQMGDLDGTVRRALSHFPWPETAQRILDRYFIEGGKAEDKKFKLIPVVGFKLKKAVAELLIVSNFVEVFLAKEGHDGPVGVNYLEKIQLPTMPSLLGAMMAGVDYVLMGAGIPTAIAGLLDRFSEWKDGALKIAVTTAEKGAVFMQQFDPQEFAPRAMPTLKRPKFLAIVSSDIIAKTLARKSTGYVDGFIVEYHNAGGHNAPPRKVKGIIPQEFGERDEPNLEKVAAIGRPFWLAGAYASPERLQEAKDAGAVGVQLGTAFAYSQESGILPEIKEQVFAKCKDGTVQVVTDFNASPTGYPFKVVQVEESISNPVNYEDRERICDLGYLREVYSTDGVKVNYRCASEPVDQFVKKGGTAEATEGKQCLCNCLMGTIGLGQARDNNKLGAEYPIITSGSDFETVKQFVKQCDGAYSASDVVNHVMAAVEA